MFMNRCCFEIGGHSLGLDIYDDINLDNILFNYKPFSIENRKCSLRMEISYFKNNLAFLINESDLLTSLSLEESNLMIYLNSSNEYIFEFIVEDSHTYLFFSKDYKESCLYLSKEKSSLKHIIDTALMMQYTFRFSTQETLLMHSSVVVKDSKAYMFLGKSGTGKSTHSRLWINNIKNSFLLNDDNPVLRIIDDKIYVYGSPWSGKTDCYINKRQELGAIVKLSQFENNDLSILNKIQSYSVILPSCSSMKWDKNIANGVHNTIETLINRISIYSLKCLPNKEAVYCCYEGIR